MGFLPQAEMMDTCYKIGYELVAFLSTKPKSCFFFYAGTD